MKLQCETDLLSWLSRRIPEHEIVAEARPAPELVCGVYFLIGSQKILYIGQSANIPSRIAQHRANRRIPFDAYSQILCAPDMLDVLERALIYRFKPQFNLKYKRIIKLEAHEGAA